MTIQEIVDHVTSTPGNSNPNVLRSMLENLIGEGPGPVVDIISVSPRNVAVLASEGMIGRLTLTQGDYSDVVLTYDEAKLYVEYDTTTGLLFVYPADGVTELNADTIDFSIEIDGETYSTSLSVTTTDHMPISVNPTSVAIQPQKQVSSEVILTSGDYQNVQIQAYPNPYDPGEIENLQYNAENHKIFFTGKTLGDVIMTVSIELDNVAYQRVTSAVISDRVVLINPSIITIHEDESATAQVSLTQGDYADLQLEQVAGDEGLFNYYFSDHDNGIIAIDGNLSGTGSGIVHASITIDGNKYSYGLYIEIVEYPPLITIEPETIELNLTDKTTGTAQISLAEGYTYADVTIQESGVDIVGVSYNNTTGVITVTALAQGTDYVTAYLNSDPSQVVSLYVIVDGGILI